MQTLFTIIDTRRDPIDVTKVASTRPIVEFVSACAGWHGPVVLTHRTKSGRNVVVFENGVILTFDTFEE